MSFFVKRKKGSLDAPSQNLARTSNSYRKVCLHESRSGRCSPVSSGVPRGLGSLRPIHCWSFGSSIRGGVLPTQLLWILTCDKRDGLIGVSLPLELEQQFSLNCTGSTTASFFLNSHKLSVGGQRHPWLWCAHRSFALVCSRAPLLFRGTGAPRTTTRLSFPLTINSSGQNHCAVCILRLIWSSARIYFTCPSFWLSISSSPKSIRWLGL